jgi:hypothetical protein
MGEMWKEVYARRLRQGLPANGKQRFGYRIVAGGVHEIDPVTGPALRRVCRRYIAGDSFAELARWS